MHMSIHGGTNPHTRSDVAVVRDKRRLIEQKLIDPHYTDGRFTGSNRSARTIYLATGKEITSRKYGTETVEGLHYNYDDRLSQMLGYDKMAAARREAKEKVGDNRSAAYFEEVLRIAMDDPTLNLYHILSGVNTSSGFSYRAFGYTSDK
jgi:hypothetical protein